MAQDWPVAAQDWSVAYPLAAQNWPVAYLMVALDWPVAYPMVALDWPVVYPMVALDCPVAHAVVVGWKMTYQVMAATDQMAAIEGCCGGSRRIEVIGSWQ